MTKGTNINPAPHHWLIAAWPGMAGVAQIGAGYLIHFLGLQPVGELAPHGHFDIQAVHVKNGIIAKPRLPKNVFYSGQLPGSSARVTVFVGEAQPSTAAYGFAHELLARAKEMGVDRLVTFASFASQLHPSENPTVFAAGTRQDIIDDVTKLDVKVLSEAQIGGLNGVLLGAAAHRGIPGLCLLGEIPFFAAQIQNPKAAKSVLEAFARLSHVELDLSELSAQAEKIDRVLLQLLERMQSGQNGEGAPPEFDIGEASDLDIARSAEEEDEPEQGSPRPEPRTLDLPARERIERLFEAARKDRTQSVALKQALDSLGVFSRYEGRFLDLFKRTD